MTQEDVSPRDEELVRLSLQGDHNAYGQLVLRYQALVKLVAWRKVGRPDAADDVAQDAFVRAWNSLASLDAPDRFRQWLLRITSNIATDHLRRRKLDTLPLEESILNEPDDKHTPIGQNMEDEELRQRIAEAIDSLPDEYRIPAILRYIEDISYKEIADRMGMKEEAIRKRLQRANQMLRVKLLPQLRKDGVLS